MSRTWKSRVGVLALTATIGIGLVGLASPAGAVDTDAAAKASCKDDGWKKLVRTDGTPFKNQGDCAAYASQGGQLLASCYDTPTANSLDFTFQGPIDTRANATLYNSDDGSCTGGVNRRMTVVSAANQAAADITCQLLTSSNASVNALAFGYSAAPSDWWICSAGN